MHFLILRVKNIQILEGGPEGLLRAARHIQLALDEHSHTDTGACFFFFFCAHFYINTGGEHHVSLEMYRFRNLDNNFQPFQIII